MSIKLVLKKIANMAGFELYRKGNLHTTIDTHLSALFNKYMIDCVMDVGANSGQYGKFLRGLGYQGWIISFEPVKAVFERLEYLAETDEKWLCYNFALGEKIEEKKINIYSSTVFSSFLEANDYAKGIWSSLNSVSSQKVSVVSLDSIFPEIKERTLAENFYLKLDTQGYDLNVFRGGIVSLDHITAMQAELSLIHVYDEMEDPHEALKEFNSNGFFVSGMFPINRDESLAVIEFDTVLVRRSS
ncbi:methyltransferase, FkbM family [Pseudomonas pohangensis]|uniref:Methyltransferase, FkbM family n=1 Tax=Pseudomonas pohangensis TaxID=364197 RepID=A0A1H2EKP5_9PSED|nr:FkbM family methyltransferase [Pseudomonas pohangensis]SDT95696.1 methyltransferase, FkbM family [Pseudomonas pohangensis]